MARKPAKMYRQVKGPAFTRRKYMGGVPNNRIMQFHMGNRRAAEAGEFKLEFHLYADEACQIQHKALEAARVISNSTIRNDWRLNYKPLESKIVITPELFRLYGLLVFSLNEYLWKVLCIDFHGQLCWKGVCS